MWSCRMSFNPLKVLFWLLSYLSLLIFMSCFNPLKVLFWLCPCQVCISQVCLFQSLKGLILTDHCDTPILTEFAFQSLKGLILTLISIQTSPASLRSFNPLKVLFWPTCVCSLFSRIQQFQSLKGLILTRRFNSIFDG